MLNRELFKIIMRGRARRPHRSLSDIVRTKEDMVEAARRNLKNPEKRTRYPGELDAPEREKQYSKTPKNPNYI